MVLNVSISSEAEAKLKSKAAAAGVDVATYAARHLELIALGTSSVAVMSGDVGKSFVASGMTEESLTDLLEEEKHQMRAERRARGD